MFVIDKPRSDCRSINRFASGTMRRAELGLTESNKLFGMRSDDGSGGRRGDHCRGGCCDG